jgi:hypothetical protein
MALPRNSLPPDRTYVESSFSIGRNGEKKAITVTAIKL